METRFNLFAHGAQQWRRNQPTQPVQEPRNEILEPTPSVRYRSPRTSSFLSNILGVTRAPALEPDVASSIRSTSALLGILSGELGLITPTTDLFTSFTQPVIVRPSLQEIAQATELIDGVNVAEGTICAVCQDTISRTDTASRIRACQHIYHQGCIDPWFNRSVFCPTCRYDIRTPT